MFLHLSASPWSIDSHTSDERVAFVLGMFVVVLLPIDVDGTRITKHHRSLHNPTNMNSFS